MTTTSGIENTFDRPVLHTLLAVKKEIMCAFLCRMRMSFYTLHNSSWNKQTDTKPRTELLKPFGKVAQRHVRRKIPLNDAKVTIFLVMRKF